MIHETALSLWRALVERAGLDVGKGGAIRKIFGRKRRDDIRSYDEDLVNDLRRQLFPGLSGPMDTLLAIADPPISAEALLRAFLKMLEPFSMMKVDILEMFSTAGAQRGDSNLRLGFHFDDSQDPLEILLSEFREQMETVEQRTVAVLVRSWDIGTLWKIPRIAEDLLDDYPTAEEKPDDDPNNRAIVGWISRNRST